MHYLDNSATTRVLPEAAEAAMHAMLEGFGNPSSQHRLGIEAARCLRRAANPWPVHLAHSPGEVTFTSGGTEAINTAVFGAAFKTAMPGNILSPRRSNTRPRGTHASGWRPKAMKSHI